MNPICAASTAAAAAASSSSRSILFWPRLIFFHLLRCGGDSGEGRKEGRKEEGGQYGKVTQLLHCTATPVPAGAWEKNEDQGWLQDFKKCTFIPRR